MDYRVADRIGKTGLSDLTSRLMLNNNQGFLSSLGSASKMKMSAASTRFASNFDPLNIVKHLTFKSPMMTALAGKMMGRSKRDISYFTGNKSTQSFLDEPATRKTVRDGVYHTRVGPGRVSQIKVGDGIADILAKLFNLMRAVHMEDIKNRQLDSNFDEERAEENRRMLEELFGKEPDDKKTKLKTKPEEDGTDNFISDMIVKPRFLKSILSFLGTLFINPTFLKIVATAAGIIIARNFKDYISKKLEEILESTRQTDQELRDYYNLPPRKDKYGKATDTPQTSNLLDAVAATESPKGERGYITMQGEVPLIAPPKPINEMTLGELTDYQKKLRDAQNYAFGPLPSEEKIKTRKGLTPEEEERLKHSTAAGKYQIVMPTLKKLIEKYPEEFNMSTKFDKETQEKMGKYLLNDKLQKIADALQIKYPNGWTDQQLKQTALPILKEEWQGVPNLSQFKESNPEHMRIFELLKDNFGTMTSPMEQKIPDVPKTQLAPADVPENKLTQRLQESTQKNMQAVDDKNQPSIFAPTTNIVNNQSGGGGGMQSASRGVPIAVRNDESSLKIAQTKYALSGVV